MTICCRDVGRPPVQVLNRVASRVSRCRRCRLGLTLHDEVEATSTVRQPREEGQGGRISTRTRRVLGRQVSPQKQKKLRFGCAWHLAELAQSPTDSSSTNEGFPISSVQLSSDQGACSVVPEESGAIRQDYEAQALWSALGMPPCPLGYSQSTRLPSAC